MIVLSLLLLAPLLALIVDAWLYIFVGDTFIVAWDGLRVLCAIFMAIPAVILATDGLPTRATRNEHLRTYLPKRPTIPPVPPNR